MRKAVGVRLVLHGGRGDKVIDEFHLTWNPTCKTYVIPRVVRQRNRSIAAIQGRKAPAQNTGGNP